MEYLFSGMVSLAVAMLAFLLQSQIKENRKLIEKQEAEKAQKEAERAAKEEAIINGLRQLLSVRMEEMYDRYEESSTIPRRAYSRWMKLHLAYKALNGNGTFEQMKEELKSKHIING